MRLLVPLVAVLVPVVEIWVAYLVATRIGVAATLLLVLLGVVVGSALMRWVGRRTLGSLRAAAATGRPPGREVVDGLLAFLGCLLVVLPGFVSDAVGLLLLLPPVRALVRRGLAARLAGRLLTAVTVPGPFGRGGGRVVPGRVVPRGGRADRPGSGATSVVRGEIVDRRAQDD